MAVICTSDGPVTEQYLPIGVPLKEHHHPTNEQVVDLHRPAGGQAWVSNTNNTKQVNNIKQAKGWQAVIDFLLKKVLKLKKEKKTLKLKI